MALASKAQTDNQHAIFLLKKERKQGNYQSHNGISTNSGPKESRTIEGNNHSSWTRI